ncbi:MAG TPA: hypothetical protein VEI01_02715 [Terriglobales bacterium]|nr:hypothetical protein [Terriglobales bacterium]
MICDLDQFVQRHVGACLKLCDEKIDTALGRTPGIARAIQQDRPVTEADKSIIIHSLTCLTSSCSEESQGVLL